MEGRLHARLQEETDGLAERQKIEPLELSPAQRRQRVLEWAGHVRPFPADQSLPQLIRETARRLPEAVAGVEEGRALTYGELIHQADRVAGALTSLGVGPGDRVGLALGRRIELLPSLVGILQTGAAFVPLDPAYPAPRLTFMIEDAGLEVIVCDEATADELPPRIGLRLLRVDDALRGGAASPPALDEERSAAPSAARPDDVAYVMYTSGSTGRPKGVEIPHRAVVNLAAAIIRLLEMSPADRILQYASISFDTSVEEIFPALMAGAAVVMRPEILPATRELVRLLEAQRVSLLDLPTAFWHEWVGGLQEGGEALPRRLRAVIIGGERATGAALSRWRFIAGEGVRLINTYGPTEATVTATAYEATGVAGSADPPIGRPLPNVFVYVLDDALRPTPVGAPGELYIGGAGLARGYLGRPQLTAARFVDNPLEESRSQSPRLYRTGDRALWGADGQLRFLSRLDDQVKIRGYRIELGEVQATLEGHPGVQEAVVTIARRGGPDGEPVLAAHLVPAAGATVDGAAVGGWLAERLPAYMIPSILKITRALPRTPNGKVDRRALSEEASHTPEGRARIAPRSHVEEVLARLWAEVLEQPGVGVTESFFDLGGHSLLALRLIDRAHQAGLRIGLEDIFQHPTIAALAAHARLDAVEDEARDPTLVALRPGGSRPPLILVHSTPGDLFGYLDLVRALGADQPCYGLQCLGLTEPRRAHTTLDAMAAHYAARLRRALPGGPYHLCGWCFGGVVAFEVARHLRQAGEVIGSVSLIDAWPRPPGPAVPAYYAARAQAVVDAVRGQGLGFLRARLEGRLRAGGQRGDAGHELSLGSGPLRHRRRVHELNMAAILAHRSRPYDGRIAVFISEDQEPDQLPGEHRCWAPLVREARFEVVPGDHTAVLREPSATALAHLLRGEIDGRRSP